MATLDDIDKRLLALEVDRGVFGKTTDLENRVRDLESMVRTARYFITVSAAFITIVGIGVTAYVAWLTSRVEDARLQVQATRNFIENTKSEANRTQSIIATQQAQATALENRISSLTQKAISDLKKAAPGAVQGAVSVVLSQITDDYQQLKNEIKRPATLYIVTGSRALGHSYPNKTGKTLIVIVTVYTNNIGSSILGNVAKSMNQLPTGANGGNSQTVVGALIDRKYGSSITFVVPAGEFYSVTTDGGSQTLGTWTEVTL